jgi:hypothetical protein
LISIVLPFASVLRVKRKQREKRLAQFSLHPNLRVKRKQ